MEIFEMSKETHFLVKHNGEVLTGEEPDTVIVANAGM